MHGAPLFFRVFVVTNRYELISLADNNRTFKGNLMGEQFNTLADSEGLNETFVRSEDAPVIIFKHSLTCPISRAAYGEMSKVEDKNIALVVVQRARGAERSRYRTRWVQASGYVYERPKPEFVELGQRELERIERKGTVDPARDRAPDLARIYAGGNRRRARDLELLGERPPR